MRVVFFGTPEFAVPTLQRLLSEPDFEVVGIVSQPDTRRGRGNQVSPPPVKAAAIAHNVNLSANLNANLKIWQPDRLKKDQAVLAELADMQADVFVVIAYGQILSQKVLNMPVSMCIVPYCQNIAVRLQSNGRSPMVKLLRGLPPCKWMQELIRGRCCLKPN